MSSNNSPDVSNIPLVFNDLKSEHLTNPKNQIFKKNLETTFREKNTYCSVEDTNLYSNENKEKIMKAMDAAISALSPFMSSTAKLAFLSQAKKNFENEPNLENFENFIAICKAHRTSNAWSFNFFDPRRYYNKINNISRFKETASYLAFENALDHDLRPTLLATSPDENKPWSFLNFWR